MALTTNTSVWRILGVIAVILTILVALAFFFTRISLMLVLGLCVILITEKLATDFRRSASRYRLSRWQKHVYGVILTTFWAVTITLLIFNSGKELTAAFQEVRTDTASLTRLYNSKIGPFTPRILGYRTVDADTVDGIRDLVAPTVTKIISEMALFFAEGILVIPLMLYVYFRRRKTIAEKIRSMVPEPYRDAFVRASRTTGTELHEFFAARVLEGAVVGGLTCLGFYIAGLQGWLILGILAGLLNIVPYFGPLLSALPPLFLALSLDSTAAALYVLLTIVITQAIDELYLKPFLLPSRVEVDTLLSIILILIGTQLFGILGTIFALPVYLVYRVTLRESYAELTRLYDGNERKEK